MLLGPRWRTPIRRDDLSRPQRDHTGSARGFRGDTALFLRRAGPSAEHLQIRLADFCRSRGVLYHCDAMQAAGKVEIDVRKALADSLFLTGRKPERLPGP